MRVEHVPEVVLHHAHLVLPLLHHLNGGNNWFTNITLGSVPILLAIGLSSVFDVCKKFNYGCLHYYNYKKGRQFGIGMEHWTTDVIEVITLFPCKKID